MKLNMVSLALGLGIGLGGMAVYYYVVAPNFGLPTFRVGLVNVSPHSVTNAYSEAPAPREGY